MDTWDTPNIFDVMLLEKHPLVWKPRKPDSKLRLSWSLFKNGLQCIRCATWATFPEKFELPESSKVSKDSKASLRGSLAQTLVEHLYVHNYLSLPPEELVQALQASWRWGVLFFKPLETITEAQLLRIRTEVFAALPKIFHTINRERLWAPNFQDIEKALWWDITPTIRLTGKADFVFKTTGLWVVDGKFCSDPSSMDDRQLTYYSLILWKMLDKIPNRASFWFYPQGFLKDIPDALSWKALSTITEQAENVANGILNLDTRSNPSDDNCLWCQHKEYCEDFGKLKTF